MRVGLLVAGRRRRRAGRRRSRETLNAPSPLQSSAGQSAPPACCGSGSSAALRRTLSTSSRVLPADPGVEDRDRDVGIAGRVLPRGVGADAGELGALRIAGGDVGGPALGVELAAVGVAGRRGAVKLRRHRRRVGGVGAEAEEAEVLVEVAVQSSAGVSASSSSQRSNSGSSGVLRRGLSAGSVPGKAASAAAGSAEAARVAIATPHPPAPAAASPNPSAGQASRGPRACAGRAGSTVVRRERPAPSRRGRRGGCRRGP